MQVYDIVQIHTHSHAYICAGKWKNKRMKDSSAQCRLAGNTAYELYINYLSARYVSALRCSLGVGVGPFRCCCRLLPVGSAWLALCPSLSLSPSFPIPFSVSLSVCLWHCSAFVWRLSVGIEAIRLFKYPVNYETDSADSALIPAKRCILMEF